jgi:hypothetical protein
MVEERRLMFWTDRPAEQDLFERTRLLGGLPDLSADGGFSVSLNNSTGNKIEVFLDREVMFEVVTDAEGQRTLVADVTFTNNAPTDGLPDSMIGNAVGLPMGASRLLVTFYGPPGLAVAMLDGEPFQYGVFPEAGWRAYRHSLTLASGESGVYHLEFPLGSDEDSRDPVTWAQPLVERELP